MKMAVSSRNGGKTSDRIVAREGLLSARQADAAPTPPDWIEPDSPEARDLEKLGEPRRLARLAGVRAIWFAMPPLVRVMFVVDLSMGGLYILSRRLREVIGKPLRDFFDLNGETNLPSWYSAAQLALIGALLIIFATSEIRRGRRAAWSMMLGGLGFLFLSLDETTSIHEHFGYWLDHLRNRHDTAFAQTGFWMLICAPLFLGGLALIGWGARRYLLGRRSIVVTLVIGAIVFVAAAAGVESLSNFVEPHGIGARALVLLEEVGEMLGATVMLWGTCDLICSHGVRLLITDDSAAQPLSNPS